MHSRLGRTLAVSMLALAPPAAQAGPPLICHPMSIGESPSLPWGPGRGWKDPLPGYDRSRLAADTQALLGPQTPVLARMETLRLILRRSSEGPQKMEQLSLKVKDLMKEGDLSQNINLMPGDFVIVKEGIF